MTFSFLLRRVFFSVLAGCLEFARSISLAGFIFTSATNVFKQAHFLAIATLYEQIL